METRKVELLKSQSDWTIGMRLKRAAWECFRIFFLPGTPRMLSPIRVFLLTLFGARLGKRVLIMGGVRVWMPWNLEVGDFSAIGSNVEIYNFAKVTIGTNSVISQKAFICTASHNHRSPTMDLYWKPVAVGDFAWVAAGAYLGPGVSIGTGSVVGARAVVTRDVPPWKVAAGNPCRIIGERSLQPQS